MSVEEIAGKIDALGVWDAALPCHWALKPHGRVVPYFCCALKDGNPDIRMRLLLLEGWQTFHDFVRMRLDNEFGFYCIPLEFPHFELMYFANGSMQLFRCDTGFVPREANAAERDLCARMLWQVYGVFMRIETDAQLPLKFAEEKSMFARVEKADGTWCDEPIEIPPPRPHVEQVSFSKKAIAQAKDLPLRRDEIVEVEFRIVPAVRTCEPKPRLLYVLGGVDAKTGALLFQDKLAVGPEGGLRALWESVAPRVLAHFIERRAIPGEVHVLTGRLFRLMRPLCLELPFKLAKVESLPHINVAFTNLT